METRSHSDFFKHFRIKNNKYQKLVIQIWKRIFGNKDVFQAYSGGQERFRTIDVARDESSIRGFMGRQEKFKKSGHKMWKYNEVEQDDYVPLKYFAPFSTLLSMIENNGYELRDSKM